MIVSSISLAPLFSPSLSISAADLVLSPLLPSPEQVHPTVDFRSVTVNDLPHIHCVETEQGPMLEWDDAEEGEEEFGPAACRSGGEGEEREELEGLGEGEGEELDWRGREGDVGRRSLD